jgi:hypothetical protein
VSRVLWKETPVVRGNTGVVRLQWKSGIGAFLVDSLLEAAERNEYLLTHLKEARDRAAKQEYGRRNLLSPRLVLDELTVVKSVIG